MAIDGGGAPAARQAEAPLRPEPPLLHQACKTRRDRDREFSNPRHNSRLGEIADGRGILLDGAVAARDEDDAAATAIRSAAAGARQSSPEAPAASLHDGSAGEALCETFNAPTVEHSHDDDGSSDMQASALPSVPGRRNLGFAGSVFEHGDELLVERRLLRAHQRPYAERLAARRYSKPHSFVG